MLNCILCWGKKNFLKMLFSFRVIAWNNKIFPDIPIDYLAFVSYFSFDALF
jgi:hypothetical protein